MAKIASPTWPVTPVTAVTVVPNRLSVWTTPGVPEEFSVMLGEGKDSVDLPTRTIWTLPASTTEPRSSPGRPIARVRSWR